ncbi:MAG: acyl-CoA/acyl-ACP dehydrogenase [Proteobacteria bacterium]|nr:acyl-CoA/acyl-ACP dehydrogenase [Pseudomonadota bacterium]
MTEPRERNPDAVEHVLAITDRIAGEITTKNAAEVDKLARFPRESMDELAERGILGLLIAKECGGLGLDLAAAAAVVQRLARECPSTAMITAMHFCATAVIDEYGSRRVREAIAAGKHLSTLAFSECGSRSQFWTPVSTARERDKVVELNAHKSFSTSASHADSYVWSSKPLAGDELSTLWLVPSDCDGLNIPTSFRGLGLRGNDSAPIVADNVKIAMDNRLGADGEGFAIMMGIVLPYFNVLAANCSIGLMKGAMARVIDHISGVRYTHSDAALSALPTIRAYVARMQIKIDMADMLQKDAIDAVLSGHENATLRILETKAAAGECATEVLGMAMRVCGGAAYSNGVGLERYFRDSQAATIMSPTTDILYDFLGKAVLRMPLF